MRRLMVVLIAVVVALLPAAGLAAGPTLAPAALRGLLEQANEKFRQATRVAPEDPAAAKLLYQESIVRFEKIIGAGNVRNGKLFYNLANAYLLKGDVGRGHPELPPRRAPDAGGPEPARQPRLCAQPGARQHPRYRPSAGCWIRCSPGTTACPCCPRLIVLVLAFDLIWLLAALKLLQPTAVLAAAARGDARHGRRAVSWIAARSRSG